MIFPLPALKLEGSKWVRSKLLALLFDPRCSGVLQMNSHKLVLSQPCFLHIPSLNIVFILIHSCSETYSIILNQ